MSIDNPTNEKAGLSLEVSKFLLSATADLDRISEEIFGDKAKKSLPSTVKEDISKRIKQLSNKIKNKAASLCESDIALSENARALIDYRRRPNFDRLDNQTPTNNSIKNQTNNQTNNLADKDSRWPNFDRLDTQTSTNKSTKNQTNKQANNVIESNSEQPNYNRLDNQMLTNDPINNQTSGQTNDNVIEAYSGRPNYNRLDSQTPTKNSTYNQTNNQTNKVTENHCQ